MTTSTFTILSPKKQAQERLCCKFPGLMLELKGIIDKIFYEEKSKLLENKQMQKIFSNVNICATVKHKNSVKNLVVKTKL